MLARPDYGVSAWLTAHWRGGVAVVGVLVLALVGSLLWAFTSVDASTEADVDCSVLEAELPVDAGEKARACGDDVEVMSERTP
jgi:hypothetical protein